MKKERLSYEDRLLIGQLLKLNYKLKNIAQAVDKEPSTMSREIKSRRLSNNFIEICDKTKRFPFVCENCKKKYNCNKKKYYYNYKKAQEDYIRKLKYSRIGIDMTIDEIEYWNDYFNDKIKNKNQPILHICIYLMNLIFLNQFKHFIIMFMVDIFLVLMKKCFLDHLTINLRKLKTK